MQHFKFAMSCDVLQKQAACQRHGVNMRSLNVVWQGVAQNIRNAVKTCSEQHYKACEHIRPQPGTRTFPGFRLPTLLCECVGTKRPRAAKPCALPTRNSARWQMAGAPVGALCT